MLLSVVVSTKDPIIRQIIPAVRNWNAERSTPLKAFPTLSIYIMWRAKRIAHTKMMISPFPIPPSLFIERRNAPIKPPNTHIHILFDTFFPTIRERIGTMSV